MTATYRLLHYEPDPFSGMRFPIGAVVWDGRRARGIAAGRLPCAICVGGVAHARMAAMLAQELEAVDDPAISEIAFGPYVRFARACTLPEGIDDPAGWVRHHILPRVLNAVAE